MPLFMVKKEVFERIVNKQKNIELRRGKARKGNEAVFQCGRRIVRGKIHSNRRRYFRRCA